MGTRWAKSEPISAPTPVATASVAVTTTSGRAPATRWLASAAIPVRPMITSDVPTARRNGASSHSVSTGTITNPPPTPKNPVSVPTSSPATTTRCSGGCGHAPPSPPSPARRHVKAAAVSITGTNASTSTWPLTSRLASVPSTEPTAAGSGEREREPPAHAPVAGERAGADRRRHRDDDQRRRRRRPDRLVEHVDEHGQREDRAAAADRADDHPDRQPEQDREGGHGVSFTLRTGSRADIAGVARLPLMLRALVLIPLLAVGLDQARVSFLCEPGAQSCLDAAGQSWLGAAGTVVLVVYMLGIAALVARLARGRAAPPLLWVLATAGLWAACGGQALLASVLGTGVALGGGWMPLLLIGAVVGALLALALRVVPALARAWRLVAPRLVARARDRAAPPRFVHAAARAALRLARARPCSTRDRLAAASERRIEGGRGSRLRSARRGG